MSTYLTETRYPLELASAMPDVWELWQRAKTLEWDPETDIPWDELHPERYRPDQIMAARLHWSRRTWGEYGAISESPALLLRFLDHGICGRAVIGDLARCIDRRSGGRRARAQPVDRTVARDGGEPGDRAGALRVEPPRPLPHLHIDFLHHVLCFLPVPADT